ncbi:MAG TPA: hypothetical protein VHP83_12720, partial [Aggregatilineaceae bacterium]|nr:hypothetical protein [Aggregatilineaceae bacterium]
MDALGDGEEVTLPRSTPKNPPSSDTEPESWEGDMQLIDGFYAYMTLGTLSAGEMCPNFGSMAGTDVITLDDKLNVDENNRLLAWIMQDGSLLPFNRPMANYYIGSVDDGFGVTQIVIEVDSVLFMEGILSISGPGCTMNTPFLIVSCMWDVVQGVPAKADGVCPADVRDTMLKN